MIWTATAITYSVVVVYYQEKMFYLKSTASEDDVFKVDVVWIVALALSCLEYFLLGCLECFMKMLSTDLIFSKIEISSSRLPKTWEKLQMRTYYFCLFAYAVRNFSFSLYFGLLSVFINFDDFIAKNPYTGPTVVLQIYLAMVRGRFYGLFMHAFLSIFLAEDDDDTFKKLQEDEDNDDDANGDTLESKLITSKPENESLKRELQDTNI